MRKVWAIALSVGLVMQGAPASAISFRAARSYQANQNYFTYGLVAGDFNGDGKIDVINTSNGASYFHAGVGDGTLAPLIPLSLSPGDYQIVAGDLNGDGKLDCVSSDSFSNTVGVALGNGDGTFHGIAFFPVGSHPGSVAIADVNGDGKPDIVAANRDSNDISVLLGIGDGTFSAAVNYPVGQTPAHVIAADLNSDGKADLAVANAASGTVSILLNQGNGTFGAASTSTVGPQPFSLVAADFNGDSKMDLAVANLASNYVSLLYGAGNGSFQPQVKVTVASEPLSLVAADFDGDGHTDLAVGHLGSQDIVVLQSLTNGGFRLSDHFAAEYQPTTIVAADLNGDGIQDLIFSSLSSIEVALGQGQGKFDGTALLATGSVYPGFAHLADLNHDGRSDIIAVNDTGEVSVLLGTGGGAFAPPHLYPSGCPFGIYGKSDGGMFLGDVNGDHEPDLVISCPARSQIAVLLGTGTGAFKPPLYSTAAGSAGALVAADFNLDGRMDVVVMGSGATVLLLGKGDGTFSPPTAVAAGVQPGFGIATADFNGEGKPDLAVGQGSPNNPRVIVLLGKGDGTFQARSVIAGQSGQYMVAADVNHDNIPDLLTNGLSVYLGNGDGTFQPPNAFYVTGLLITAVAGDVDGDGKPDIIGCGLPAALAILKNTTP